MDETFYAWDYHPNISAGSHIEQYSPAGSTWATMIVGPGTSASSGGTTLGQLFYPYVSSPKWSRMWRSIIRFPTYSLFDDAVISAATLRLRGHSKADPGNNTPQINVYGCTLDNGQGCVLPIAGDFDSIGAVPFCDTPIGYANWNVSGWNEFVLNAAGIAAISLTDWTVFGLREVLYDVAANPPSWYVPSPPETFMRFHGPTQGTVSYRPQLVVTYVGIPTVTTQAVTDISGTTATGNGNVTSLGGSAVTQHGHCWNTTGTPTTADSKTENGAKAATGAFTSAMTSLTEGTKYYVRAYATNSSGTGYGNQVEFTADKGTVYPINPLLRASGIIRTFWAGIGGQSVYQTIITMGGIGTTYVSPISSREPPSAVTPTPPSGAGYLREDYLLWIKQTDWVVIIRMFGHFPSYEEWLEWRQRGLARW